MRGYGLAQSQPCDQVIQSYFSAEGKALARVQYADFTASCIGRSARVRGPNAPWHCARPAMLARLGVDTAALSMASSANTRECAQAGAPTRRHAGALNEGDHTVAGQQRVSCAAACRRVWRTCRRRFVRATFKCLSSSATLARPRAGERGGPAEGAVQGAAQAVPGAPAPHAAEARGREARGRARAGQAAGRLRPGGRRGAHLQGPWPAGAPEFSILVLCLFVFYWGAVCCHQCATCASAGRTRSTAGVPASSTGTAAEAARARGGNSLEMQPTWSRCRLCCVQPLHCSSWSRLAGLLQPAPSAWPGAADRVLDRVLLGVLWAAGDVRALLLLPARLLPRLQVRPAPQGRLHAAVKKVCMQLSRNPAGLLDSLAGFLDSLGSAAWTQIAVCEKAVGHAAGAEPSLVHVGGHAPLALFLYQYTKFFVP